jgi:hypothetical protein
MEVVSFDSHISEGEGQCLHGCREYREHKPSYVEGRAVILRANCAGDSMRRKGLEKESNVGDQRMKSKGSHEVQVEVAIKNLPRDGVAAPRES